MVSLCLVFYWESSTDIQREWYTIQQIDDGFDLLFAARRLSILFHQSTCVHQAMWSMWFQSGWEESSEKEQWEERQEGY